MIINVDSIVFYFITMNFNLYNMFINTWLIFQIHRTQEYKSLLVLRDMAQNGTEEKKGKKESFRLNKA